MLCPSVFQPVSVPVPSLLDLHWPVRSLWPELRPLLFRAEAEMLRHLQELQLSLGHMERLHQRIFQELDQDLGLGPGLGLGLGPGLGLGGGAFRPIGFTHEEPGPDGAFALSLDTADFSPSELRVSQVGRKLRVSGRSERTRGGGGGDGGEASNSYRCQEFRQEIDLPGGVDAGAVTCSLQGGRLHIQAPPQRAVHDGKERVVPITLTSAPAVTSPPPPSESGEEN